MDSFTYEDRSIREAVVSLPVHQQTAALPPDVQCSLICHQLHLRVFPDLVDLEVFLLLARSDLALDKGCVSIKQLLLRGAAQLVIQELQYFLSSRIFLLVLRNKTSEFPQYFTYGNRHHLCYGLVVRISPRLLTRRRRRTWRPLPCCPGCRSPSL